MLNSVIFDQYLAIIVSQKRPDTDIVNKDQANKNWYSLCRTVLYPLSSNLEWHLSTPNHPILYMLRRLWCTTLKWV